MADISDTGLTVAQARAMSERLSSDSAVLDIDLLLCHVLQVEPSYLRTWPEKHLTKPQQVFFLEMFERRCQGEPVAHITGHRGFWSLDLETNASTLVPRPDTECLVEEILETFGDEPCSLLDLGTGTGAIALAIAAERPKWQVFGVDISPEAVQLARRNALRNQISNVDFFCGSWFEAVPEGSRFDVIVSNPPYIDASDPHLELGDLRFEPRSALVAGNGGFADIEIIATSARDFLKPGGWLYFEHGYEQAKQVRSILRALGYQNVYSKKDYGGNDRVSAGLLV